MPSFMEFAAAIGGEGALAELAAEGFGLTVWAHVDAQIWFFSEAFIASRKGAFMWLRPLMQVDVST